MNAAQDWGWMTPGGFDQALNNATPDENACLRQAAGILRGADAAMERAHRWATLWVEQMRSQPLPLLSLERLLQDYPLTSPEGIALMRLAEALVRTPDAETRAALLADKLSQGRWQQLREQHSGLQAWQDAALAWAARIEAAGQASDEPVWWKSWMNRGVDHAAAWMLRQIGSQFVAGVSVQALDIPGLSAGSAYETLSFDSLGESAQTDADVAHYLLKYQQTAEALPAGGPHGLSVKLSALHPRFDELHRSDVVSSLPDRVLAIARIAAQRNLPLTIDAEECDRLMLTLDVAHALHEKLAADTDAAVRQWQGLGLAVQAYQKRALSVIELLIQHARDSGRRWQIRLVKGAYWDTEIIRAQQAGLKTYPVLTSRAATDMNYIACARLLLRNRSSIYPMFGTHNALTLAAVLAFAVRDEQEPNTPADWNFECQRLHGMGEALWACVRQMPAFANTPCRVYTPIGTESAALSYLIRRLLENGANSSFVHQVYKRGLPLEALLADPLTTCTQRLFAPAEGLPDPPHLHAPRRSAGSFHLYNRDVARWAIHSAKNADSLQTAWQQNFAQRSNLPAEQAFARSTAAFPDWSETSVEERAALLERWADRIELRADQAVALLVGEARKTLPDACGEIRETIDLLRYYAQLARDQLAHPVSLKGPHGESNQLSLHARGPWLCISPWNFPLAIFIGQIAATLVCGNTVIAKPAEQTPGIATWAVEQAVACGLPDGVLQLMPVDRQTANAWLQHPALCGVSFTGSNPTARQLRITLANREGAQVPLIAETGGMNAMVVDSTALPEQATDHIIESAFNMAGQRCSALRVLFVQEDIADTLIERVMGRMSLLKTGLPATTDCDVPPLIDQTAVSRIQKQWSTLAEKGQVLIEPQFLSLPDGQQTAYTVSPGLIRMPAAQTAEEIFGPILQVCTFRGSDFDSTLQQIAGWGWGLTFGLQSRMDSRIRAVERLPVGNVYVNRPMIGAVVGVQPFGGQGLSGTGPKAGGPNSLRPYCTERLTSINTAAAGGVMELLTVEPDAVKLANRFDG